jgi:hypothetical protein
MTIFYCLRFEIPPTWRARSPYLHSHRNRVTQLYPQTPGSHFITSYEAQGYGGGIRTPSYSQLTANYPLYNLSARTAQKTVSMLFRACSLSREPVYPPLPSSACFFSLSLHSNLYSRYTMKAYGGSGSVTPPFLTSTLDGGEWTA